MTNIDRGKLYTTYFASGKSEGLKLAVVRHKPKWLDLEKEFIVHMKHLSPIATILSSYNQQCIDWCAFKELFEDQIRDSIDTQKSLEGVKNALDSGSDVTLICYERDESVCHRSILGEYFREHGYEVREL